MHFHMQGRLSSRVCGRVCDTPAAAKECVSVGVFAAVGSARNVVTCSVTLSPLLPDDELEYCF